MFSINGINAQKSNYKIDNEILITEIDFSFEKVKNYSVKYPDSIIGVRFNRINDSISRYYLLTRKLLLKDFDPLMDWNYELGKKIPTKEFDEILKLIQENNLFKNETSNFSRSHPKYSIKISSSNYSLLSVKSNPYWNTKERNLAEFLVICEKMMGYIDRKKTD